jgi:ABC-2 type transport system permease protein
MFAREGALMQVFFTLLRRELGAYFVSLTGYVIIAAATFLVGESILVLIHNLGGSPTPRPVTEMFHQTPFFWLILILAAPVITMRSFALERYSGTYETLMTTPVSDLQVVAAKFTAAWGFYLVMWLPMVGSLYIVQYFARQSGALDPATVGGMYLGIALVGALLIAMGCFASSLTSSQMVAAMVTLTLGVALFALAYLAEQATATAHWQAQVLASFALFQKMNDFARGVVDVRALVFFLSLTLFFLFLTLRAVESRRWK